MARMFLSTMSLIPQVYASGVTEISDIIVPEVFSPYVQILTAEKSRLVQSGALVNDARLAEVLAGGGLTFTNLTQDHLDYHGTMDAYLDAKLMLFDGRNGGREKPCVAVVNADDPCSTRVPEAKLKVTPALK